MVARAKKRPPVRRRAVRSKPENRSAFYALIAAFPVLAARHSPLGRFAFLAEDNLDSVLAAFIAVTANPVEVLSRMPARVRLIDFDALDPAWPCEHPRAMFGTKDTSDCVPAGSTSNAIRVNRVRHGFTPRHPHQPAACRSTSAQQTLKQGPTALTAASRTGNGPRPSTRGHQPLIH
jgi:hypothetical protein